MHVIFDVGGLLRLGYVLAGTTSVYVGKRETSKLNLYWLQINCDVARKYARMKGYQGANIEET